MLATRDAVDGLEARVDNHYRELKELRGRVNAMRRWEKAAEDAPGDESEQAPVSAVPPPPSTAHLALRFKRN